MLLIAVVILVFVGPDRIPELMSTAGKYYGKFRRMSDDLRRAFNAEVARSEAERRRVELQARHKELSEKRKAREAAAREAAVAEGRTPEPPAAEEAPLGAAAGEPDGAAPWAARPAGPRFEAVEAAETAAPEGGVEAILKKARGGGAGAPVGADDAEAEAERSTTPRRPAARPLPEGGAQRPAWPSPPPAGEPEGDP